MSKHKLPMTDPRYNQNGIINVAKWSRENEPKPLHKRKVGAEVIVTCETTIAKLTHDCDGTALYSVDRIEHGLNEGALTDVPPLSSSRQFRRVCSECYGAIMFINRSKQD